MKISKNLICALLVCVWASYANGAELQKFEGETMGTTWHVSVVSDSKLTAEQAQAADTLIADTLKAVDYSMSTWKNFTKLSRINSSTPASKPIVLADEVAVVLRCALNVSEKTDGAYDVTVGPLVNLWKFGPTSGDASLPEIPSDDAIEEARAKIGFRALKITPEGESGSKFILVREKEGILIDLSSIAKGYGADCVARALVKAGYSRFLVEIGGEVVTRGKNAQNLPWQIGIENPVPGSDQLFMAVPLEGRAMATSGDYRNFRMEGDTRRSHIIDPRTGRPVEHKLVSVSVVANDCMSADAWATALMVLGPEEGAACARREHLSVLFLIQDGSKIVPKAVNFPFALPGQVANVSKTRILPQILISILAFCIFFVAIGYSHMTGRRKMMCSCKAAKLVMNRTEKKNDPLVQNIPLMEDVPDRAHFKDSSPE